MDNNFYLITSLDYFVRECKKYIHTKSTNDSKLLDDVLARSNKDDWTDKNSQTKLEFATILKKYFPVKFALFPWYIPNCCGGVYIIIRHKKESVLNNLSSNLKLNPEHYTIGNKKIVEDEINMVYL